jgi:hypothetical protein
MKDKTKTSTPYKKNKKQTFTIAPLEDFNSTRI